MAPSDIVSLKAVITFYAEITMVSSSVGLTAIADSCLWVATVCLAVALAGFTVGEVEEARSALQVFIMPKLKVEKVKR